MNRPHRRARLTWGHRRGGVLGALRSVRVRITLTLVALTLGSLLVTGAVTVGLEAHGSRVATRKELARSADALAVSLAERSGLPARRAARLLRILAAPLRLEGAEVLAVSSAGHLGSLEHPNAPARLPGGLRPAELEPMSLREGTVVSGNRGQLAYAAAPFGITLRFGSRPVELTGVVVVTRLAPSGAAATLPGLLAASVAVAAVAVAVGDGVSRRIVRPLREAEAVTARIADGDLDARVEIPVGSDGELVDLASAINAMGEDLARSRQLQRQYLLSVSHDLRTPLSSIRGWAEALEDGAAPDPARAGAVIAGESRRLERLVGDLLELGRLEQGRFTLRVRPVALAGALSEVAAAFEPYATEIGLRLDVVAGDPSGTVEADPDRLGQVLTNLVENALAHASGEVRLASAGATLWVDDDGPGIPPEAQARVFEPFVTRSGAGRRVGTGLGLAIVAELVRAMQGRVSVASPLGPRGGTRVLVELRPAAGGPGPDPGAGPEPPDGQ